MALFEARGLHKRFGHRVVLERIDVAFEEGRLSGIMGPNGAGKTTCFNLLTGRFRPDRGQILFAGRDITGLPPRQIATMGVARSFQVMTLFDDFTALENLLMALPRTRSRRFDPWSDLLADKVGLDEAAAILAQVGLAGRERRPARDLSYGERRALEIAVALAARPQILFLDEPTAGLGTAGTARLRDLILRLKAVLTIVVIEHDMQFLFDLADHVAVIHWGQVIASGTPAQLMANPWVRRSQLGSAA